MTTLLSDLQSDSLILTLNRPSRANSFNFELVSELQHSLADAEKDPRVRCVVITGAGKVFSAGQDITEMKHGELISYRYEGILQEEAGKSAEHREGVAAFLGKRAPKFK